MWSVSVEAHESTSTLVRVARPLAGSVALHLALLTIVVVAGSAALAPLPVPRATWLDLEPAEIAPPPPAPVAASPRPRSAPRPPDASAGGPIVRAARPRGGYQVRPVYPESARRAGIQGTTLLRIYIERDGRVGDVSVQRSAGHQALDEAAADAVRRWRFEPALNSAGPVSMWALVPVEFRISDRD